MPTVPARNIADPASPAFAFFFTATEYSILKPISLDRSKMYKRLVALQRSFRRCRSTLQRGTTLSNSHPAHSPIRSAEPPQTYQPSSIFMQEETAELPDNPALSHHRGCNPVPTRILPPTPPILARKIQENVMRLGLGLGLTLTPEKYKKRNTARSKEWTACPATCATDTYRRSFELQPTTSKITK